LELEASLPRSQEPNAGLYPEPDESVTHSLTLFPQDPFLYYASIYAEVVPNNPFKIQALCNIP
jgi:hypothetical protein